MGPGYRADAGALPRPRPDRPAQRMGLRRSRSIARFASSGDAPQRAGGWREAAVGRSAPRGGVRSLRSLSLAYQRGRGPLGAAWPRRHGARFFGGARRRLRGAGLPGGCWGAPPAAAGSSRAAHGASQEPVDRSFRLVRGRSAASGRLAGGGRRPLGAAWRCPLALFGLPAPPWAARRRVAVSARCARSLWLASAAVGRSAPRGRGVTGRGSSGVHEGGSVGPGYRADAGALPRLGPDRPAQRMGLRRGRSIVHLASPPGAPR